MGQSSAHPPRRNRNIVHAVVQYDARLVRIGIMGYEPTTTTTAHVPSCRNIYTLLHCIRKQRVSLGVGGSICRRSRGVDLMHMRAVGPAPAGRGGETIIVRPTYGYPSVSCHVQCSAGAGMYMHRSPAVSIAAAKNTCMVYSHLKRRKRSAWMVDVSG
jgi:hypothetical protein